MRKYIIFLMALCLHSAARGQTQYEYWFDNDHSTAVTSTSSLVEADVSGLSETLHAIHIQVKGTGTKVVDHTIYTWKDENIDFEQYVVNTENEQMLSAPITRYFVKVLQQGITVRCWVDGNLLQESVATGQTVMLDLAAVSDGFHYLTVQPVGQGGGVVGTPHAYPFIKVPKTAGIDNLTCYYTIDGSFTGYVAGNLGNGTFQFDVDVSLLTDGIHPDARGARRVSWPAAPRRLPRRRRGASRQGGRHPLPERLGRDHQAVGHDSPLSVVRPSSPNPSLSDHAKERPPLYRPFSRDALAGVRGDGLHRPVVRESRRDERRVPDRAHGGACRGLRPRLERLGDRPRFVRARGADGEREAHEPLDRLPPAPQRPARRRKRRRLHAHQGS